MGQSQIVTINFRNSTDSAIYCDITLKDENFEPIIVLQENLDKHIAHTFRGQVKALLL